MDTQADARLRPKQWAKRHFVGFENILLPSFTPDLRDLDEEGIRHDVRLSIRHGFFSVFCVGTGLSPDETQRFFRVVADEAAGRVAIGTPLIAPTEADRAGLLSLAAAAGVTHLLPHPFPDFHADTESDLERFYRSIIHNTDLAVVLWATDGPQFQNLHPSNVVLPVFDRLADCENVVAIKLMTTLELPTVYECCERLHDRLLIGGVHLGLMPLLTRHYGMQWSGAWTVESLQSAEQPLVGMYLDALVHGRTEEAMKLYWRIKPAYDALFALMAPMLPRGVHPFTHLKYYQWCVGGNGGLLREPWDPNEREFPLRPAERRAMRAAYRLIGIEPTGDDDAVFVVGRAAHRRGARPADMPVKPTWED
jgi:4-hydroxy-tetrahydrodipicolinate synthase